MLKWPFQGLSEERGGRGEGVKGEPQKTNFLSA